MLERSRSLKRNASNSKNRRRLVVSKSEIPPSSDGSSRRSKKIISHNSVPEGIVNIISAFFEFLTLHVKRPKNVQDQKSSRYRIRKMKENVERIRAEQWSGMNCFRVDGVL